SRRRSRRSSRTRRSGSDSRRYETRSRRANSTRPPSTRCFVRSKRRCGVRRRTPTRPGSEDRSRSSSLLPTSPSTSRCGSSGYNALVVNRLAQETSPYLRQHADNPVDWYPWGEDAFGAARERDVPIFLSVGYSSCHWCHVMAHESFENEATGALMNELFVNVK